MSYYPGQYSQNRYNAPQGPPPNQMYQQPYQQPPPPMPNNDYRPYPSYQQFAPPSGPPPQMHYGQGQGYGGPPNQQQPMHFQPPPPQAGQPYFEYSNCSGKRKALCIGINYTGTSSALNGCHNDVKNVSRFLQHRYNYHESDMVLLLDEPSAGPRSQPTRQNILDAMRWLVAGAQPNDALFFHFSGHGGQAKDQDGDEEDGFDETIYPVDHKQAGVIIDDELHAIMVQPLPHGCRLTAVFDCCHSGSGLDLPYMYSTQGKIKEPNMLASAGKGALGAVKSYAMGDVGGALSGVLGIGKKLMSGNNDKAQEYTRRYKSSPADVISFSGCKDDQTSADANISGQGQGAMSWALLTALTKNPQQSYIQLLNSLRDELSGKYSQKPQLSASHEIDINLLFIM